MNNQDVATGKAAFRADARARRRAFLQSIADEERDALTNALADRALPLLDGANVIATYWAMGGEVDPKPLENRLKGRHIALPWFESRASYMQFRIADAPLEPGPFGTLQPLAAAELVRPDAVLVPLVAADRLGNRVGQGQGHFDRTLAALRAERPLIAIGLAWDVQIFNTLPVDAWDERLDAVVTPTRVFPL